MIPQDIKTLFALAIGREFESYEFYHAAAEKVSDTNVKEQFTRLAQEELGHRDLLQQLSSDPALSTKFASPVDDYGIAEATELPKLTLSMSPVEAIALAMKKEEQAVAFYKQLSYRTTDIGLKTIMENLAIMEQGHKTRLEGMYVDIGYPEVF